jgi:bifunctional UDP-N-acetylglucosamine pyrophosphorylase / glucosamine-1-phosphate N-acetyltransferase
MSTPSSATPDAHPRLAVILAAGHGKRMRSAKPKVLHEAGGRPLLEWVVTAARAAGCARIAVVVGHGGAQVRNAFADASDLVWVEQREQNGTGHALLQAAPELASPALALVLSGDVPLVRPETLARLAEAAATGWGAMAVAKLAEPGALGRVVGDADDRLVRIVEARDATPAELAIRTVNAGLYALPAPEIVAYLRALRPNNSQGELYLTDAVTAAARDGRTVRLVELADPDEALGVNDRVELARVDRLLNRRTIERLALAGVTFLAPETSSVGPDVAVGRDTVVHPQATLAGATRLGDNVVVHTGAWLRDSAVGDGAVIEAYSVLDGATVGDGCRVGPFARLRPAAVLQAGARVGNFVEVKQSTLGPGAKANHLAYLGDATVGAGANIGAGVVTCNYDGVAKHPTTIGAGAFVGSDTMLVAPVTVGENATTGAGSVITTDVPDGALAVERARQRTVAGWSERRRPKNRKS